MEKTNLEYSLSESSFEEEITSLLKLSKPLKVLRIDVKYNNIDYETGNFNLIIQGKEKEFFEIPFVFADLTLNKFINFINEMSFSDEPLIFYIFNKGVEYLFYYSKINNSDARFLILNTSKLFESEKKGKILSYSYLEAEICLDIIINKRTLIKQIVSTINDISEKYKNVAYFEQKNLKFENFKFDI